MGIVAIGRNETVGHEADHEREGGAAVTSHEATDLFRKKVAERRIHPHMQADDYVREMIGVMVEVMAEAIERATEPKSGATSKET